MNSVPKGIELIFVVNIGRLNTGFDTILYERCFGNPKALAEKSDAAIDGKKCTNILYFIFHQAAHMT